MSLVTSYKMLQKAQGGGYAVGAFNVENMEMVKAVIGAAQVMHAPVIVQTTPSTVRYGTLGTYYALVAAEAERASIPVCLHLDHGSSFEIAIQAIRAGYTSVMIDGSGKSFEDNVALTQMVVNAAHACKIPVEAELGRIGGKEDDLEADGDQNTDPDEAWVFAERTEIDSLAIAIGTAHGFYAKKPALNKMRITEIKNRVSVPLVLHGASGLSNTDVRECIARGICKVNFATELRVAYADAGKKLMREKPDAFDPKQYGMVGMAAVDAMVRGRIDICGCAGKAE